MPKYLVRVDAINLYANAVGDCQQLSALRGGGLMLLNAIKAMADTWPSSAPTIVRCSGDLLADGDGDLAETIGDLAHLKPPHKVWSSSQSGRTISQGASSLLCEVSTTDAKGLRKVIEDHLSKGDDGLPVSHATFAVSVVESDDDQFKLANEAGMAANRWRQMQSASVVYPQAGSTRVCDKDMVRPAQHKFGKNERVSESVWRRYEYGRAQKQKFYNEWTGIEGLEFVNEIDDLCQDVDGSFKNLGSKYALIHMDGNRFGDIQRRCTKACELKAWDDFIRGEREEALKAMLGKIRDRSEWKNVDKIRIETLLWGGDETIWVVPAWCGWAFLEEWFRLCRGWPFAGENLTHAAGMVFCHEKAPIHRVRELAIALTEATKNKVSHTEDMFSYLVLESFDQIGRDLDNYREKIEMSFGGAGIWTLDASKMADMRKAVEILRQNGFPRSKIADIARAIADGKVEETARLKARLELSEAAKEGFKSLNLLWPGDAVWLHLAELWDYLAHTQELTA